MEEEKIKRIRILRRNGHGYQRIADRLGISVGSVYKYAKDVPLEEDKRYVRQRSLGRRAFGKVKKEKESITNESEKDSIEENERRKYIEEKERRKYNEELHERGTKKAVNAIGEVVKLGGSMVGEKNPRGHGAKVLENAWGVLDVERELVERRGDARLLFGNLRKIFGDQNSLMGLGYLKIGREGIFGRVNKIVKGKKVDTPENPEKRERSQKETKETKKKEEGTYY